MWNERMRYLGALGLLCECSPLVTDDLRESIERALQDACADGALRYRRILDRFEIEPTGTKGGDEECHQELNRSLGRKQRPTPGRA